MPIIFIVYNSVTSIVMLLFTMIGYVDYKQLENTGFFVKLKTMIHILISSTIQLYQDMNNYVYLFQDIKKPCKPSLR